MVAELLRFILDDVRRDGVQEARVVPARIVTFCYVNRVCVLADQERDETHETVSTVMSFWETR